MAAKGATDIKALTGLRGVAATTVVLSHVLSPGALRSAFTGGYLSVDLFFVLSGFIMVLTYGSAFENDFSANRFGAFLWARFARLYPLYFVVLLEYVLISNGSLHNGERRGFDGFVGIANVTLTQAWVGKGSIVFPAWSISTEVVAYVLFPAFLLLTTARSILTWIGAAFACFVYIHVAGMPTPHPDDVRTGPLNCSWVGSCWPVLRCCSGFLLGMIAYRLAPPAWLANKLSTPVAVLMVAAFFWHGADLVFVAAAPVLVSTLYRGRGAVVSVLAWTPIYVLGELSYAIYLLHPQYWRVSQIVTGPLAKVSPSWAINPLATLISTVVLLLAAWSAHTFLEKPARRMLRQINFNRKPVGATANIAAPAPTFMV